MSQWKREIKDQAKVVLERVRAAARRSPKQAGYFVRRDWALEDGARLAGVVRAIAYSQRKPVAIIEIDVLLKRLIDEKYNRHPFYGGRKMVGCVAHCGHRVNRKRAQCLMPSMGLAATVAVSTRDGHTSSKRRIRICCAAWRWCGFARALSFSMFLQPLVAL